MSPPHFDVLHADMRAYADAREYFVRIFMRRRSGAPADVRVVTELAWHGLFMRHLLRRPNRSSWTPSRPNTRSSTAPASAPIRRATAAAPKP
jgi:phosphoenolpyruvate carboxykinase (ATP)